METLLAQEKALWKHRTKVYWLKDGDTNSRFFHAMATTNKRQNNITNLSRDDGEMVMSQQEWCGVANNYFVELFDKGE